MKFAAAFLLIVLISGCSGERNKLITNLIDKRKVLIDSLEFYRSTIQRLQDRGSMLNVQGSDSVLWSHMLDTARKANDGMVRCEIRIPGLTYSIDSLGK
jgi:hypothetical protein